MDLGDSIAGDEHTRCEKSHRRSLRQKSFASIRLGKGPRAAASPLILVQYLQHITPSLHNIAPHPAEGAGLSA